MSLATSIKDFVYDCVYNFALALSEKEGGDHHVSRGFVR